MANITATIKYSKISPQKLRLLRPLILKKRYSEALSRLTFCPQKGAAILIKLLKSAQANAINNYNFKKEDLIIGNLFINQGPFYKRRLSRSRGRTEIIKKPTSHTTVILKEEKIPVVSKSAKNKKLN